MNQSTCKLYPVRSYHLLLIWFLSILIGFPDLCNASQRSEPDTTYVLTITRYKGIRTSSEEDFTWQKRKKSRYISEGATISLELIDGKMISDARLQKVSKDFIVVMDESIPIDSISYIKIIRKGNTGKRVWGTIVSVVGLAAGIYGVAFSFFEGTGKLEIDGYLLGVVAISIGIIVLGRLLFGPRIRFDLISPRFSLGTSAWSELSEKVRKRLSKKHFR